MVKHPSERTYSVAGTVLGTLCALTQIFTTMQGGKYLLLHMRILRFREVLWHGQTHSMNKQHECSKHYCLAPKLASFSLHQIEILKKKKKGAEGSALKEITVEDRMWSGSWARQRSGKGWHGRDVWVKRFCRGAPWVRLSCLPAQHSVCWRSKSQLGD